MKKRVLLLASPYMDIYKDIIDCLTSKDYDVVWISDGSISGNPYNKSNLNRHTKTIEQYQAEVDSFWNTTFQKEEFANPFNYFLAVDGFMVTPYLFEKLDQQNPTIRKVLYLYDRIKGNYEIDMFFKYYNGVFSFDLGDCEHYKLHHLPIYWVPVESKVEEEYDIFGMASFSWGARYDVYRSLKNISKKEGLRDYIKLYHPSVENKLQYLLKYAYYKLKGEHFLSLSELRDDLFTDKTQSPEEFRCMIRKSKVILDTQNSNQDGMTARFMWALGAEKKIITTNKAAKLNSFYTPEQIYILTEKNYDGIPAFIRQEYHMPENMRSIVESYSIVNWIDTMLN